MDTVPEEGRAVVGAFEGPDGADEGVLFAWVSVVEYGGGGD